jgi:hypothetical protein
MSDDVRRAFATLGLPLDSSRAAVARQYKILVKRWHPDRFTGDPQGVVEATARLRAINVAHDTIKAQWPAAPAPEVNAGRDSRAGEAPRAPEARPYSFTRDQIDEIVAAMRYRESLWERLQDDPWNRALSLLLAIGHLVWAVWLQYATSLKGGSEVIALSILMSGCLLPFMWSDQTRRKVFGWFWWLFFGIVLPAFVAWMDQGL